MFCIKATEQYFHMVLFVTIHRVILPEISGWSPFASAITQGFGRYFLVVPVITPRKGGPVHDKKHETKSYFFNCMFRRFVILVCSVSWWTNIDFSACSWIRSAITRWESSRAESRSAASLSFSSSSFCCKKWQAHVSSTEMQNNRSKSRGLPYKLDLYH